jgi:outer membrane protein assembly factor BamD (BamD/ComL family)
MLPDRPARSRRYTGKASEARLKALLQQYPDSFLKPAAEERLRQVQDNLGLHNLLIANYYYNLCCSEKKGGLKGAHRGIGR